VSIEAMSWVLTKERTTVGTERVVLLGIEDHADKHGCNSWPSYETLAEYANVSRATAKRAVKGLIEKGLVQMVVQGGGFVDSRADRRTNRYDILGITTENDGSPADPPSPEPSSPADASDRANDGSKQLHGGSPADPRTVLKNLSQKIKPKTSSSEVAVATTDPAPIQPVDRPDVEALCQRLACWIEDNGGKFPPITKAWRDPMRLMLDKDGYTIPQVAFLIDWCQQDEFWRGNILSPSKLRAKANTLRLHAMRQNQTKNRIDESLDRINKGVAKAEQRLMRPTRKEIEA
jgi:hypothetical protein